MKKLRKAAPAAAEKCLPPDHGLVNSKVLFGPFFGCLDRLMKCWLVEVELLPHLLQRGMVFSRYHEPNASLTSL